MAGNVKPIPEGNHTVTPYLSVKGAAAAIEFYKKAFGAVELCRMPDPMGRVMHAELRLGDSVLFLSEECPGMNNSPQTLGGTTVTLHLYVENVDAAFNQAVAAGAQTQMPPTDMFWGDRFSKVVDPFGHSWGIATHVEDVSAEEMERRTQEFFAKMAQQQGGSAA